MPDLIVCLIYVTYLNRFGDKFESRVDMSKIGLVVEGGGMKCAYSAGLLDAFLDDNISFKYCIGVSAGSANVASYLAGQRGRNKRFYTEHIHEPGYFGFRSYFKNRNLFGLQYIYGTLSNSNGADYLDYRKMILNPAEYLIVANDANTGEPKYFNKEEMPKDDYRIIMASSAMPGLCLPVEIDGHYYFDGCVADSIPVKKALDDGCDKVVVILSKPRDYVKKPEKLKGFYAFKCKSYPKIVESLNNRHITYTESQQQVFELEKQGKVFVFAPNESVKLSTFNMDAKANGKLYDMGLEDYINSRDKFRSFMGISQEPFIVEERQQLQELSSVSD